MWRKFYASLTIISTGKDYGALLCNDEAVLDTKAMASISPLQFKTADHPYF
jgi:hypothetical protein